MLSFNNEWICSLSNFNTGSALCASIQCSVIWRPDYNVFLQVRHLCFFNLSLPSILISLINISTVSGRWTYFSWCKFVYYLQAAVLKCFSYGFLKVKPSLQGSQKNLTSLFSTLCFTFFSSRFLTTLFVGSLDSSISSSASEWRCYESIISSGSSSSCS